jgi:methionine synthase I (cobalamin-dependent)
MQRKYTNRRYLDAVNDRVIIFDGAMGTSLQTMQLILVGRKPMVVMTIWLSVIQRW